MVEVMKIMVTAFKMSHAGTATLSAPNPAAGHHRPTPLPETPGHSQASLGQSLVGSLLLSPGFWCSQVSVCPLQESISQSSVCSKGFPGGSDGKVSARNVGDLGSIPWLGRCPGEANGNPLQYSCLENSTDGGAWWATVHGVTKSRTRLSDFTSLHFCMFWQLCGGVDGDLLQEGLCHTQVCCTQGPCPCGSPLLTRTSTGDTQTQVLSQSLWGPWI